jgi:hypothetical protein
MQEPSFIINIDQSRGLLDGHCYEEEPYSFRVKQIYKPIVKKAERLGVRKFDPNNFNHLHYLTDYYYGVLFEYSKIYDIMNSMPLESLIVLGNNKNIKKNNLRSPKDAKEALSRITNGFTDVLGEKNVEIMGSSIVHALDSSLGDLPEESDIDAKVCRFKLEKSDIIIDSTNFMPEYFIKKTCEFVRSSEYHSYGSWKGRRVEAFTNRTINRFPTSSCHFPMTRGIYCKGEFYVSLGQLVSIMTKSVYDFTWWDGSRKIGDVIMKYINKGYVFHLTKTQLEKLNISHDNLKQVEEFENDYFKNGKSIF